MTYIYIRRYFLFALAVIYFFTLIVPFFKSLPLTPGEGFYMYLWLVTLFILKPDILFTKEFGMCSWFLVLHFFYLIIDHYIFLDERITQTMLEVFVAMFFPMSIWAYFRLERDMERMKWLCNSILVFIFITTVTTFTALQFYPSAVRDLVGNDNVSEVSFYLRLNIGSYFFQYLLVFVTPLMLYFYKLHKNKIWLILFFAFVIEIVYAQIMGAIVMMLFNIFLTTLLIFTKQTTSRYFSTLVIMGIFFLAIKDFIAQFFYFLAESSVGFYFLSEKFYEIASYIETGGEVDKSSENAYAYEMKYQISERAFLDSPITGGTGESGGHQFWIDNLAEHGIVGTIGWFVIFIIFFRTVKKYFSAQEGVLILNSLIVFFLIGIGKNIIISTMCVIIFFIVPFFLYFYGQHSVQKQNT